MYDLVGFYPFLAKKSTISYTISYTKNLRYRTALPRFLPIVPYDIVYDIDFFHDVAYDLFCYFVIIQYVYRYYTILVKTFDVSVHSVRDVFALFFVGAAERTGHTHAAHTGPVSLS